MLIVKFQSLNTQIYKICSFKNLLEILFFNKKKKVFFPSIYHFFPQ